MNTYPSRSEGVPHGKMDQSGTITARHPGRPSLAVGNRDRHLLEFRRIRGARTLLAALILVLASAVVPAADPSLAAAGSTGEGGRITIDQETCSFLLSSLRAPDSPLSPAERRSLKSVTDSDCFILVTVDSEPSAAPTEDVALLSTTCATKQGNFHIYAGPIETYTARQAAYVCWNGSTVWRSGSYINCWVTSLPGYAGEPTWCGVLSGNNTALLSLEHDFKIWTWAAPWWNRYGWAVTQINKNGGVSVYGFCCN